ncbi:SDR family NAD(P)-dependent oxidoreductase [Streptomyces sp. NBC_01233]|uniref:SDR family NAD(P)-dependent oxidoreductase n=1 Tax=Streptomyces sp. NBC_01233 TaxID=2903787 RepID=UPI002E0D602A|nr:glucose 1-dehydrogenase [Streptomyces sp. NBC_01233]
MSEGRFADQVAIVTGGAAGIGKAVATRLATDGAHVVLVDRDEAQLEKTVTTLGTATAIVADVRDEAAVADYVRRTVADYGRVDLFFNNAGIEGPRTSIIDLDTTDFDRVMSVNVRGVFLGLREVMRAFRSQGGGGAIVNTASMAGIRGSRRFSPYVASKHAVVGLTRCAALDGAEFGIRVNAVAPGLIDTRMLRAIAEQDAPSHPEELISQMAQDTPLKRSGTADEVANMVTWLLSSEASYITGTINLIDAGLNA